MVYAGLMRKLWSMALCTSLGLSLAIAPTAQAKVKVNKPSAPTIVWVSSHSLNKGKMNVTVTLKLPSKNGGSKILGSKVQVGRKSCTIKKKKTSCTIKGIVARSSISVVASSKNRKGYGVKSKAVCHTVGGDWYMAIATPAYETCTGSTAQSPATYAIGATGPGGGKVFMLPASKGGTGGDFYYEAAPVNWFRTGIDPLAPLCIKGLYGANADLIGRSSIGEGYLNTQTLEVFCTSGAGNLAALYAGGGKTDWFLPSRDELSQLFQNKNAVGDLNTAAYWSSTGSVTYYPNYAWGRFMGNGYESDLFNKTDSLFVRPVRAFK